MQIGSLAISKPVFLAPMAGITDHPFRVLCREMGAGVVYTEFVSANGIIRENMKTLNLMKFTEEERPIGIQLFGEFPEIVGKSAKMVFDMLQPDIIDFMRKIKKVGYLVKLDTNGTRPDVVRKSLTEKVVDFIAMDIKAPFERLNELTGISFPAAEIRRSIDLIARSGIDHLFRTTDVRPLLSPADLAAIKQCVPAGSPHIVQSFVAENALSASLRTKARHVF